MGRPAAAIGSAVWFVCAPILVAGALPWWLTGWDAGETWLPFQALGWVLIVAGTVVLLDAFTRFVLEGDGTPAPVAPPTRLVVGGLYRFVRNPMYIAVVVAIVGQALVLGRLELWLYAVAIWWVTVGFVRWIEEPMLRADFGGEYERYRRAVPAWVPRRRAWRP